MNEKYEKKKLGHLWTDNTDMLTSSGTITCE